jgi:hypothetical protein
MTHRGWWLSHRGCSCSSDAKVPPRRSAARKERVQEKSRAALVGMTVRFGGDRHELGQGAIEVSAWRKAKRGFWSLCFSE